MRTPQKRSTETAARFLELEKALGLNRQALAKRIAQTTGETFRAVEQRLLRIEGYGDPAGGLVTPIFRMEPMLRAAGIANADALARWYVEGGRRPQVVLAGAQVEVAEPRAAQASVPLRAVVGGSGSVATRSPASSGFDVELAAMGAIEALRRAVSRHPDDRDLALALAAIEKHVLPSLGSSHSSWDTSERRRHASRAHAKKVIRFVVLRGGSDLEAARRLGS